MLKREETTKIEYNCNNSKKEIEELKVEINSLSDFIKVFENELDKLYKENNIRLYFRGEKELYDEPCTPSLFRKKNTDFNKLSEDEIYYRILRRQPHEFNNLTNLDILAKMQHYGVSTRLLDITTNPLIALFFALENSETTDGYVYIFTAKHEGEKNILSYDSDRALLLSTLPKLNDSQKKCILEYCNKYPNEKITPSVLSGYSKYKSPRIKNQEMRNALGKFIYECERERHAFHKNHRVDPQHLKKVYFVKPRFTNERLKAQEGLFVLFGLGTTTYDGKIYSIKIPKNVKKFIKAELFFFAGISNSTVYQGLDTLATDCKDELYSELIKNRNKNIKKCSSIEIMYLLVYN